MFKKGKTKKTILYALISFLSILILTNFASNKKDFSFMRTSILSVLNEVIEDKMPEAPDLSIKHVVLNKISEPNKDFDYYKYSATLVIANEGGTVINGNVKLSADAASTQKYIKNTERGFSLGRGQKYIVENFELVFDGKYNGGEVNFALDLKSSRQKDYYLDNNFYKASYFSGPAKLKNIKIEEVYKNGKIQIDFELDDFSLDEDNYQIVTGYDLDVPETDLRYAEYYDGDSF